MPQCSRESFVCAALYCHAAVLLTFLLGGHVYHMACIRQLLTSTRQRLSKACPSCRNPFDHPIPLFLELSRATDGGPSFEPAPDTARIDPAQPEQPPSGEQDDTILPDISFYQESMASLQTSNDFLTSKLHDMERIVLVYQRRCEAQEEAKAELKRQIYELGSWLERVRRADADKEEKLSRAESSVQLYLASIKELEEERDSLYAENQHFQSLRITDDMMRILRSLESEEIQEQIASLRAGSKEEIIVQLQVALGLHAQMKDTLEHVQEELLDCRIEMEGQRREIAELRKGHRQHHGFGAARRPNAGHAPLVFDFSEEDECVIKESAGGGERSIVLPNIPNKLNRISRSKTSIPNGSGGSYSLLQPPSGKSLVL